MKKYSSEIFSVHYIKLIKTFLLILAPTHKHFYENESKRFLYLKPPEMVFINHKPQAGINQARTNTNTFELLRT